MPLADGTPGRRIAIVDGVRTPWSKAGTGLKSLDAVQLAAHVFRALLDRANLDAASVDEVILGCVGQPADAQNIARAAGLMAGVPHRVPAVTVHRNCASGFEAITTAAERIASGRGEIYLVGGSESMSNYAILYPSTFADWLAVWMKAKSPIEKLAALAKFRFSMLSPRFGLMLGLTDYACGQVMGTTAENLAVEFGISRREQDEYALESHRRATTGKARRAEETVPVPTPPFKEFVTEDNGVREKQSLEDLAKLKPYFDRLAGTVTVGNSCPVSDGAAALLVMTEEKARALGYEPLGYLRDYAYAGLDPRRMGLGPVFSTAQVLARQKMKLSDMDLIELNEAFAAQVIACERAFASASFAERELGLGGAVGELDPGRLNVNGGAIALGHPVGATGARLVLTLLAELRRQGKGTGLATLCIGGGQGGALVVER